MKSKLKRFVDLDNVKVGDISLGTIVLVHERFIVVQFFNNISAYVPISQLSLEYIKKISENYEKGQTVRVRVMDIQSHRDNQIIGSLILDPTLKVKKEKQETENPGDIFGRPVESFVFENSEDTKGPSIDGKTNTGEEAVIHDTDLAMDQNVSKAFFQ